jgi:Meiotically Up-regulated Gene 113 (MUG113) protein
MRFQPERALNRPRFTPRTAVLKGHDLSGKALRRVGTPFSDAYNDVERWLAETAPSKPKRPKRGFVYVIGMVEDATAVKIGFATDVDDRRSTLQTSSHHTLKVLAVVRGTRAMEKELHCRFASDHIRGEWFRRSEAVEAFIAANVS